MGARIEVGATVAVVVDAVVARQCGRTLVEIAGARATRVGGSATTVTVVVDAVGAGGNARRAVDELRAGDVVGRRLAIDRIAAVRVDVHHFARSLARMAEPHRRVAEFVQEEILEVVADLRDRRALGAGRHDQWQREVEDDVARDRIGEEEIVARRPVADGADEREAGVRDRANAATRMSGVVAVGAPIARPGSATGPTKLMPATACQVAKARCSAASKAPAPYTASKSPRSWLMWLVPVTSGASGKLACIAVPSGTKPHVTVAGVPKTGSSHFEP